MALISYIGLYYLLDCDYLFQYEVGTTVFYHLFLWKVNMSLASAIVIGTVNSLGYFNKTVEQYNKFKVG